MAYTRYDLNPELAIKQNHEVYKNLPNLENLNGPDLKHRVSDEEPDKFKKYSRFHLPNVYNEPMTTGIGYFFMTKPELNINPNKELGRYNLNSSGYFQYIAENYPDIIDSLCASYSSTGNFIKLLTNKFERIDLEDVVMREKDLAETWNGYRIKVPFSDIDSINGGSLAVTYDEYKDPLILKLHKIWFDYINKIKFGYLRPDPANVNNKIIDYTSSAYYFVLAPDGETIRMWIKYTGIAPRSLPYSMYSGEVGVSAIVKASVQYVYSHKEYLEPESLLDFNDIEISSSQMYKNERSLNTLFETNKARMNRLRNDYVDRPLSGIGAVKSNYSRVKIVMDTEGEHNNAHKVFKLKFYD